VRPAQGPPLRRFARRRRRVRGRFPGSTGRRGRERLPPPLVEQGGTVRQFYPAKGHGFVRLDGGGTRDNVFFHRSAVEGATDADLVPGRGVSVVIEVDADRGPRASRLLLA
jgi:cold shock CspA family protein